MEATQNINTQVDDVKNFNQIYAASYSTILGFITHKIGGKNHIAEELTNDVFLQVSKHLQNFDPKRAKISTWVYSIAKNKIIDYYRSNNESFMLPVDDFLDDEGNPTFQFTDSVETDDNYNSNEAIMAVNQAVNNLKNHEQQIAFLYFIKEKKYTEIAELLNIPMGTVKGKIYRIRTKLQNELSDVYAAI